MERPISGRPPRRYYNTICALQARLKKFAARVETAPTLEADADKHERVSESRIGQSKTRRRPFADSNCSCYCYCYCYCCCRLSHASSTPIFALCSPAHPHTTSHAVATSGHAVPEKRHTILLLDPPTPRRLALPKTSPHGRFKTRQGRCKEAPVHGRCHTAAEPRASKAVARLQSRGLLEIQCLAAVALQGAGDGPLLRRHDGRRDLPRDDAPPECQAHLYAIER